jgi:hypothetical protein
VPDATLKRLMVVIFTLDKWEDEIEIPIQTPNAIPISAVMTIRVLSFDLLSALKKK